MSVAGEDPIVVQAMGSPALDFSRTDGELINGYQRGGMRSAVGAIDFAENSAIVYMGYGALNDHPVDQIA